MISGLSKIAMVCLQQRGLILHLQAIRELQANDKSSLQVNNRRQIYTPTLQAKTVRKTMDEFHELMKKQS